MFGCDVYINFNWFPRNHTLVDIKLHNFLVWSDYDLCYFPASLRNILFINDVLKNYPYM